MAEANTLAYYDTVKITTMKRFAVQPQGLKMMPWSSYTANPTTRSVL
jgi:hypothetical protein